jgi:molybdopterin-guanine dinucleotide biosynthesis protein A
LKHERRTVLILAGGKGSRFGCDKGLSAFEGTAMIKRVLEALRPLADSVVVAVAPGRSSDYRKAVGDAAVVVEDTEAHRGPLRGLKDALAHVTGDVVILSACDMPRMKIDLYQLLIDKLGSKDAAMPFLGGYNEPIMGVYRLPQLKKAVDAAIAKGEVKLSAILRDLDFIGVSEDDLLQAGIDSSVFTNLNQPSAKQ